jgi:hypothetical protein
MAIENLDLLAHRFEDAGHPQLATQRIAVGSDVTG